MLAVISACTSASPPRAGSEEPASGGADCFAPPWTPSGPSLGIRVSQCNDTHVYRFVLGAGSTVSEGSLDKFLNAHRDEFHAVRGIVGSGYGLCCTEDKVDPNNFCIVFDLRTCSTPVSEFIARVRELQLADRGLAGRALQVSVHVQGLEGPRCEASEECGPLPYSDQGNQDPPERRTLVDPAKPDTPTCSHDGACVANGCGNECDHWTLGGAFGTCPYLTKLEGAFCGCAEEHCALVPLSQRDRA